jgi:hypothetical protein
MRVTCTSTPEGRVYNFYRVSDNFSHALKPLVPVLLASHADVVVGPDGEDFSLQLRVGPISGDSEATLLGLIGSSLTHPCEPAPSPG